jgi:hypothetical protein
VFVVVVAPKTLHHAQISALIRPPQDLFSVLGSRANAVEDADR